MGNNPSSSRHGRHRSKRDTTTHSVPPMSASRGSEMIPDQFSSVEEVTRALRRNGLESCNLIIGIDFTKSNEWSGKRTFNNECLHQVNLPGGALNPYEEVIETIGATLRDFDDDNVIPVYGFGDDITGDHSVFTFATESQRAAAANAMPVKAAGFPLEQIRQRYREILPNVVMAGPTSFAPIINEAVNIVNQTGQYHILVIIADGQVTRSVDVPAHAVSKNEHETINAIIYASQFPLSIVMVGVGDGPWDSMVYFDNYLMQRKFDNFQFVEFHKITSRFPFDQRQRSAQFALQALMEIPEQYQRIKQLGYLGRGSYNFATNLPEVMVYPAPQPMVQEQQQHFQAQAYPWAGEVEVSKPHAHQGATAFSSGSASYYNGALPDAPPAMEVAMGAPVAVGFGAGTPSTSRPSLQHAGSSINEESFCAVCEERPKDTVFQCGHRYCAQCAHAVSICPHCREEVKMRIKCYD